MNLFALIHSPLVGPVSWELVGVDLERRGHQVLIPDLDGEEGRGPHWKQHARAAASALGSGLASRPVLVGHSGAGQLLPAIRQEADRAVAGYIFVDAGLPRNGEPRGAGTFAEQLRKLYAGGSRFPNWTETDLRQAIPDPAWRQRLLSELRPQPLAFWEEPIPVFAGWPDAPCGYLRFGRNPAYDEAAAQAHQRGWPYIEIPGHHFHMLVGPAAVATALLELVNQMTAH